MYISSICLSFYIFVLLYLSISLIFYTEIFFYMYSLLCISLSEYFSLYIWFFIYISFSFVQSSIYMSSQYKFQYCVYIIIPIFSPFVFFSVGIFLYLYILSICVFSYLIFLFVNIIVYFYLFLYFFLYVCSSKCIFSHCVCSLCIKILLCLNFQKIYNSIYLPSIFFYYIYILSVYISIFVYVFFRIYMLLSIYFHCVYNSLHTCFISSPSMNNNTYIPIMKDIQSINLDIKEIKPCLKRCKLLS